MLILVLTWPDSKLFSKPYQPINKMFFNVLFYKVVFKSLTQYNLISSQMASNLASYVNS